MLFLNSNRKTRPRARCWPDDHRLSLFFFSTEPGALIRNCAPFLRAKSTDRKIIVSSLPIARIALFCVLDGAAAVGKYAYCTRGKEREREGRRALEKGTKKREREREVYIGNGERGEGKSKSWLFRGLKLICMESTAKRLSCRLDFVLIRRQIARVRSCVYSV